MSDLADLFNQGLSDDELLQALLDAGMAPLMAIQTIADHRGEPFDDVIELDAPPED